MSRFPPILDDDPSEVRDALEIARTQHERGELHDAMRWLRRAADVAFDRGHDQRGVALSKVAADLGPVRPPQEARPQPPPATSKPPPYAPPSKPPRSALPIGRPPQAPPRAAPAQAPPPEDNDGPTGHFRAAAGVWDDEAPAVAAPSAHPAATRSDDFDGDATNVTRLGADLVAALGMSPKPVAPAAPARPPSTPAPVTKPAPLTKPAPAPKPAPEAAPATATKPAPATAPAPTTTPAPEAAPRSSVPRSVAPKPAAAKLAPRSLSKPSPTAADDPQDRTLPGGEGAQPPAARDDRTAPALQPAPAVHGAMRAALSKTAGGVAVRALGADGLRAGEVEVMVVALAPDLDLAGWLAPGGVRRT